MRSLNAAQDNNESEWSDGEDGNATPCVDASSTSSPAREEEQEGEEREIEREEEGERLPQAGAQAGAGVEHAASEDEPATQARAQARARAGAEEQANEADGTAQVDDAEAGEAGHWPATIDALSSTDAANLIKELAELVGRFASLALSASAEQLSGAVELPELPELPELHGAWETLVRARLRLLAPRACTVTLVDTHTHLCVSLSVLRAGASVLTPVCSCAGQPHGCALVDRVHPARGVVPWRTCAALPLGERYLGDDLRHLFGYTSRGRRRRSVRDAPRCHGSHDVFISSSASLRRRRSVRAIQRRHPPPADANQS